MPKAFRYRLYPTKAQQTKLNETLELLRWVYNETLTIRKDSWEQEKRNMRALEMCKLLYLDMSLAGTTRKSPPLFYILSHSTRMGIAIKSVPSYHTGMGMG